MNSKTILNQHKQFCKIWQATDGRFKTKLPDETRPDGKKLVTRSNREDLEKLIINWYKSRQTQKEPPQTMKTLHPEWLKYKTIESSNANAAKLQWVWEKYYADSEIIHMDLAGIDVITMKEWLIKTIEEHMLSSRRYKEIKSVANMLLDYAVEKRLVTVNVSRNVHGISNKKYTEPPKKSINAQVYIDNEEQQILEQAEIQYQKTHNIAYLAICLNFSLALRVGEIIALQVDDFSDFFVKISRQEVKNHYVDENGKFHTKGYSIAPYPKTEAGKRDVFLSKRAKKYLAMILEHNRKNGFNSNYLFLDKNGHRIHEFSVNNALRNLNQKIGTIQKSNHKIRKTCISKMILSKKLTNEEIRMFAGHEDFSTTEKFYEFPTASMLKRADAFEAALS